MERSAPEYSQSGLPSPYPSNFGDNHSEGSSADHASAAQYPVKQEVNYSTSGTPTSEYGVYPQSGRSGSFPEHIQRSYHPASSASSGGMAQQQNSPSMPQQDGRSHQALKSDNDVPIDPSIAAPSPTYPYGQHSPYAPNPDMTHSYSHPSGGMYAQPRPDWTGYGQHGAPPMAPGHPVYAQQAGSAPPQQRPNQVSRQCRIASCARLVASVTRRGTGPRVEQTRFQHGHPVTDKPCARFTHSSQSPAHSNTSDRADATRRLSACTSVDGMDARRPTVLSTISTHT